MTRVPTARATEIENTELGFTLMHEHLFLMQMLVAINWPHLFDREAEILETAKELQDLHAVGVNTIVDLTTVDLSRDVALLKSVALRTDVNIIVATGVHMNPPGYFRRENMQPVVDLYVRDITQGVADTGVRAGILKVASEVVTPDNEVQLRAVARAHRLTGVPISTHTNAFKESGLDQQRVFKEEGVDLTRVIIGHSGDTTDLAYLTRLLEAGSTIGMDRFGARIPATTHEERCQTVAELCRRGWASQMILSHDASSYNMRTPRRVLREKLPEFNFFHVPTRVIPALKAMGVTEAQIHTMMVENPRRIFERQDPY